MSGRELRWTVEENESWGFTRYEVKLNGQVIAESYSELSAIEAVADVLARLVDGRFAERTDGY